MATEPHTASAREQLDYALVVARRTARYWWIVLLVCALGTGAAVGLALYKKRSYESSTVIMYRDVIPADLVRAGSSANSARFMRSRFREMLMARPLLQQVIEEKGLFASALESRGMAGAVELMRQRVSFDSRGGGTFHISFLGSTPKKAQEVTALLAKLLIQWELRFKLETVSVAKDFLNKERLRVETQLRKDEKALAEFVAAHPEFAEETLLASGAAGVSIRARNTERTNALRGIAPRRPVASGRTRLYTLERQRTRISKRLKQKAGSTTTRPAPRLPPSPAELRARARLARVQRELDHATRQLADFRVKFTNKHPDVVSAAGRVTSAKSTVASAKSDLAAATPTPHPVVVASKPLSPAARKALLGELRSIDRVIASERRRLSDGAPASKRAATSDTNPDINNVVLIETTWTRLVREAKTTRDRYESIRSKAFTAQIMASSEVARQGIQLTVVNPAQLPTHPAGAGRKLLVMAGFLFSGMLGLGIALGLVFLDDRIFSPRDIENLGMGSMLAVIPSPRKDRRT